MLCKKLFIIIALTLTMAGMAHAADSLLINYQGKLLKPDGTPVADGKYQMQFAIYDAQYGGTALWSETNPAVQVTGGLYATMLGSVNPLPPDIFNSTERYFGLKVGDDPEMVPRQKISGSAYAQTANTVPDG